MKDSIVIIAKDNIEKNQQDSNMLGNFPQSRGENTLCREGTTMTMTVGNGLSGQKCGVESRKNDMHAIPSITVLQYTVPKS